MTQFIYRIVANRPEMLTQGPTAAEAEVLEAHVEYLEQLAKDGTVLLAGRTQTTDPGTFGLVILADMEESAARRVMSSDPAVREMVMDAELFPYRIAVVSPAVAP